jgi:hypothetical protein
MNAGKNIPTFDKTERFFRSLLAVALITAVVWALTGNAPPDALLGRIW